MIICSNLNLEIDGRPLLQGVDFEFSPKPGEHLVIYGPNGAGKTLLTQVISGNLAPSAGHIEVLGQDLSAPEAFATKAKIGYVSPKLFDDFAYDTPVINVVMSGLFGSIGVGQDPTEKSNAVVKAYISKIIREKHQGQKRATEILEKLDCPQLAQKEFGECSYGQKNRILIARALINHPQLLILDEPSTGLDLPARAELSKLIKKLSSQCTLVLITHHSEEILPCFTHTLLLKKGRVFKYSSSQNAFTSKTLSDLMDLPIEVHEKSGRYFLSF